MTSTPFHSTRRVHFYYYYHCEQVQLPPSTAALHSPSTCLFLDAHTHAHTRTILIGISFLCLARPGRLGAAAAQARGTRAAERGGIGGGADGCPAHGELTGRERQAGGGGHTAGGRGGAAGGERERAIQRACYTHTRTHTYTHIAHALVHVHKREQTHGCSHLVTKRPSEHRTNRRWKARGCSRRRRRLPRRRRRSSGPCWPRPRPRAAPLPRPRRRWRRRSRQRRKRRRRRKRQLRQRSEGQRRRPKRYRP